MRTKTSLEENILPFKSCGSIVIGSHLSECDFLSDALWAERIDYMKLDDSDIWVCEEILSEDGRNVLETKCYFKDHAIKAWFNASGVLYFVLLGDGYKGKAFGEINIGSTLGVLRRIVEVEYDSGDEAYYPSEKSGVRGIAFYTGCAPSARPDDEDLFILEGGDPDSIDNDQVITMISIQDWNLQ
jgi:hypothetical protein